MAQKPLTDAQQAAFDNERDKINDLHLQTIARFEQAEEKFPGLDAETAGQIVGDVMVAAMCDMARELIVLRSAAGNR
jgi:hypothetical protein